MKEIVILARCDRHGQLGEAVPGNREVIASLGLLPKTLDLCDDCFDELVKPLRDLLAQRGVATDKPPKKMSLKVAKALTAPPAEDVGNQLELVDDANFVCPFPDCRRDDFLNDKAIINHAYSNHKVAKPEWKTACAQHPHLTFSDARFYFMHMGNQHDYNAATEAKTRLINAAKRQAA